MKVTIITVSFNSEKTIEDTILSVLSQEYPEIEYIIIDGASTDRTLSILNKYRERISVVISEPDLGIYDAMNKGIANATGDIIGILNSDDIYVDSNVIGSIVTVFQSENCDGVYADLKYVDYYNVDEIKRKWISGKFRKSSFLWGWMPPHPTFFVKRNVFEMYGVFNLGFRTSADYELMLRFLFKYSIRTAYLPKVIVKMRTGGFSNSSFKHRLLANKEDALAWKVNGLKPYLFTTILKPLRKILQYVFLKQ